MNPISRKPAANEVKPYSRNSRELRKFRDKPSFFKSGANTSIGMTIGRMDQEDSVDANALMGTFGQPV